MQIEIDITKKLIAHILAEGYDLGVNDGEETTLARSGDAGEIFEHLRSTEMDYLYVVNRPNDKFLGEILLIWGNGQDVISDHSNSQVIDDLVSPILDSI